MRTSSTNLIAEGEKLMAKPNLALVERVIANIHTAEDADYFFDQLKSPGLD